MSTPSLPAASTVSCHHLSRTPGSREACHRGFDHTRNNVPGFLILQGIVLLFPPLNRNGY